MWNFGIRTEHWCILATTKLFAGATDANPGRDKDPRPPLARPGACETVNPTPSVMPLSQQERI